MSWMLSKHVALAPMRSLSPQTPKPGMSKRVVEGLVPETPSVCGSPAVTLRLCFFCQLPKGGS